MSGCAGFCCDCLFVCLMSVEQNKRQKTTNELFSLWVTNEVKFIKNIMSSMEFITKSREFRKCIENGQHIITVPLISDGNKLFTEFARNMHESINQEMFKDAIKRKYDLKCSFSIELLKGKRGYLDGTLYSGKYLCVKLYPNLTGMET